VSERESKRERDVNQQAHLACPHTIGVVMQKLLSGLVVALNAGIASAQNTAPYELTRLTAPITVDGNPNEPAWEAIPELPLTMYAPIFRGNATQRSVIKVAYDDGRAPGRDHERAPVRRAGSSEDAAPG
jgi:hypothetical protein